MIWSARSRTALQADFFVALREAKSVPRGWPVQASARRYRGSRASAAAADDTRTPGPGAAWSGGRL